MPAVTRSQVRRAADRDLRMSARAATPKTTTKKKKKKVATALLGAGGIEKRERPASASEGAEVPKAAAGKTFAEASFILKLKEEAYGAMDLWKHRHAPEGALDRWLKAKEEEARAEAAQPKKTKMVVKERLSRNFIDVLRMQQPGLSTDVPDEYFADKPESCRHLHAMWMYMNSKMYAYHQALIDQYFSQGYAEDEDEVTTDGEQEN